jgi:hypothetical protein
MKNVPAQVCEPLSRSPRAHSRSPPSSPPGALLQRHAESQRRRRASGTSRTGTLRPVVQKRASESDFGEDSREARKMLKLALAKSVVETRMLQTKALPQGAVFYPTMEQFADPIKYIARFVVCNWFCCMSSSSNVHAGVVVHSSWYVPGSIEKEAARTGVCKIVPPRGWRPPFAIELENERVQFDTRKQKIHELQVRRPFLLE